jgi:hypothetical protein
VWEQPNQVLLAGLRGVDAAQSGDLKRVEGGALSSGGRRPCSGALGFEVQRVIPQSDGAQ